MSVSTATARPIDLAAILDTQQPSIDLRLSEFESASRRFLKAVALYTGRALEEIGQRKARHAQELKRIAEKRTQSETEITACKKKEIQLMEVLEHEQAERRDAESSVSELKRQFASIKEKCASADVELEQFRDEVQSLRREKSKDMSVLDIHASRTSPELKDCERMLQCIMEGVGRDKLLVRFLQIDPSDPGREYSVVIDVSSREYEVPMTTPPIPTLPLLIDHLNKTRDLYEFVRRIRQIFEEMVAAS